MKNTTKTLVALSMSLLSLATAQDVIAPSATVAAPAATVATPSDAEIKQVFSYFLGYGFGQQLAQDAASLTADDFSADDFFKGLSGGLSNNVDPAIKSKDIKIYMDAMVKKLAARDAVRASANKSAGEQYLANNAKAAGVTTTATGLQYKVLTPGTGAKYDAAKDGSAAVCSVSYEGRLVDGKIFDQSQTPVEFPINQVVPGFSEALKLMPVGSEWEVSIPSKLGYGPQGPGVIGNDATLIFKLKLHGIKPGQDTKPRQGTQGNPIEMTPEILEQLKAQGIQPVGQ